MDILKWIMLAAKLAGKFDDPDKLQASLLEATEELGIDNTILNTVVLNLRAIVKDNEAWAADYALVASLFESGVNDTDESKGVVQNVVRGEFLDWLKENWKEILETLLEIFSDDEKAFINTVKAKYSVQLSQVRKMAKALAAIDQSENAKELFEQSVKEVVTQNIDGVFTGKERGVGVRVKQICAETETSKISPTTIILLIEMAVKLIEWWRDRKNSDNETEK